MSALDTSSQVFFKNPLSNQVLNSSRETQVMSLPESTVVLPKPNKSTVKSSRHPRRMLTKRLHRKGPVRSDTNSIAPLLETISALAANSDGSDSDYSNYEEKHHHHHHPLDENEIDEDEEDENDQFFFQNHESSSGNSALVIVDDEKHSEIEQGNLSDALAVVKVTKNELHSKDLSIQQNDDESRPVTYIGLKESYSLPQYCRNTVAKLANCNQTAVANNGVRRKETTMVGKINLDWPPTKTTSYSNVQPAQMTIALNSAANNGKSVRFHADVKVNSTSPRIGHKPSSGYHQILQANLLKTAQDMGSLARPGSHQGEESAMTIKMPNINAYDEVAHSSESHSPQHSQTEVSPRMKKRNEPININSGGSGGGRFLDSLQRKKKINRELVGGSPVTLSVSPPCSSGSDNESSMKQPQYANIEMIQLHNKSTEGKDVKATQQQSQSSQQQKSILKDTLCAKLRSAIRKGQFASSDPSKLENEIDSLLYGPDSSVHRATNVSGVSGTAHESNKSHLDESKHTESSIQLHDELAKLKNQEINKKKNITDTDSFDRVDMFCQNYVGRETSRMPYGRPKGRSTKGNIRSHIDSNAMPCNSYIQMIEEKYRLKETSLPEHHQSGAFRTQKQSKTKQQTVNKVSNSSKVFPKSNIKLNDDQNGSSVGSKMGNNTNSIIINGGKMSQTKRNVSSHSQANSILQVNSAPINSNDQPMLFTTPNMSQLMSDILQESYLANGGVPDSSSMGIGQFSAEKQNRIKSQVNERKRFPTNVAIKSSLENDRLYSMFADPVKGPSINMLMDELSRNFQSLSDTESIKSGSNVSTLSKSLAENHIYEEILYECLGEQEHMNSNDASEIVNHKKENNSLNAFRTTINEESLPIVESNFKHNQLSNFAGTEYGFTPK